jgi:hypothetical protein
MLWSIEYYAQFFDVDTKQVLERCWAAVFPKTPFLDVLGGNPDLYGPFWISSTTIIILYFSSTLAGYLAAVHNDTRYFYDFTLLTAAAGLMYGYAGIVPTVLWGAMKWYGCEPSLLEILCLYGYGGMIVWIPVVRSPPPSLFPLFRVLMGSHFWLLLSRFSRCRRLLV